jgi:hypothetical protein
VDIEQLKQCHLWQKDDLTRDDLDFRVVARLEKSSHGDRVIVKCNRCGQHYLFESVEEGKWAGGDVINTAIIPVDQQDLFALMYKPSVKLFAVKPRLHWEGDKIYWIGK